jgi:Flagellar protein FliT
VTATGFADLAGATPWEELLVLAEREHACAQAGDWEGVAALGADRARRSAALAAVPPAAALAPLRRLEAVQQEIVALLVAARADTVRELGRIDRGRSAVRGYGAGAASPARLHGTA